MKAAWATLHKATNIEATSTPFQLDARHEENKLAHSSNKSEAATSLLKYAKHESMIRNASDLSCRQFFHAHELPHKQYISSLDLANRHGIAMDPTQRYKFQALDQSKQHIRLFSFTCADTFEPDHLQGTLETFDLDDCSEFTALSYEWGQDSAHDWVSIESTRTVLSIRVNLATFLRRLRERQECDANGLFWVDQLCIDQRNSTERGHQIALMSRIYEQATKVISWLGDNEEVERFLAFVDEAGSRKQALEWNAHSQLFRSFRSASYWDRMWIRQEVLLACQVQVMAGRQMTLVDHCEPPSDTDLDIFYVGHPLRLIWKQRGRKNEKGKRNDLMLVTRYQSHGKCADLRDKVYGLLTLVRPEQRIEVDYELPVSHVCLRALNSHLDAVIRGEDELDTLGMIELILTMEVTGSTPKLRAYKRGSAADPKREIAELQAYDLAWRRLEKLPQNNRDRRELLGTMWLSRDEDSSFVDDWLRRKSVKFQQDFGFEDGDLLQPLSPVLSVTRMFWVQ